MSTFKMEKIMFRSTNRNSDLVSFKDALLQGQAPDYGLYMPVTIPVVTAEELEGFRKKDYFEIAFEIVKKFTQDEINKEDLKKITKDAYNFDVPLEKIIDNNLFIMRLDRGPTASFKDFAARLMAKLMESFAKQENKKLIILVATSGDTGGAVAHAFHSLKNINVVVLFPEKEITERQRRQMTTLGGNITAVAVQGKFDDCQAIVKRCFNDTELKHLNLTSANSINFGRLLPQTVYYFYAYSRLSCDKLHPHLSPPPSRGRIKERGKENSYEFKIIFSVPSGNFGNLMGGVLAKKMGLPVEKFIVAVNENDEFPDFLTTGNYTPVIPSKECSSNAMNVGHPSNLARLIDSYGGWLLDERDEKGRVTKKGVLKEKPDMQKLREDFESYSITDSEADETIKKVYEKYKIILEPHGAVAFKAVEKSNLTGLIVSLETADPAKFPEKITELLKIVPELPESLTGLDDKKENYETIENTYEDFKQLLHFRAINRTATFQ